MRFSQPTTNEIIPYSTLKIEGCSDATIGFQLLSEQPSVGRRRYCNKVLVHECISVPDIDPVDLVKAEFLATSDPCYGFFEIFKTSEDTVDILATIELQKNDDDLTIGLLITFASSDTCGIPQRLAYRLYGYLDEGRILLANGNLYVTPCCCGDLEDAGYWTDVNW